MATFNVFHRQPYPAIDPTLPVNSNAGRTILITGASSGIGRAIARAYIASSAARVIIAARRVEALASAVRVLEEVAATSSSSSKAEIVSRQLDLASSSSIETFWKSLKDDGISVDILVLNATRGGPASISNNWKTVWEFYETNVLGNLRMSEEFLKQGPDAGKFLINLSTVGSHFTLATALEAYATTKCAFTHLFQCLADEVPASKCQMLSFHPGRIFSEGAVEAGFTEDTMPWDNENLPAHFCVWASTSQAAFLHGRFVWAHWGVDELERMRERFEKDHGFLKIGLQGFRTIGADTYLTMV